MDCLISVENIKCGGCANNIKQKLTAIQGVQSVDVDVEVGQVAVVLDESIDPEVVTKEIKAKLLSMGYPEAGSVEGLQSVGAKAKSFVSCAIGKMSDDQ